MKVEIKNNNGVCEYFKIDGKKFGTGIYSLDIHIEGGQLPQIIINAKSDEFIMNSENAKLYLKKYEEDKVE
jgi:hypothetical protein